MPVRLSNDRLDTTEGRAAPAYIIPAGEAEAAAATENLYAVVGVALALVCVIGGIAALFVGISATSGKVEIPLPTGSSITFDGTPVGIVLAVLGFAFFWISRPQVTKA